MIFCNEVVSISFSNRKHSFASRLTISIPNGSKSSVRLLTIEPGIRKFGFYDKISKLWIQMPNLMSRINGEWTVDRGLKLIKTDATVNGSFT